MGLLLPFEPAEADYPNHLALPEPERLRLPPAAWLMTAMVVLCLVPRAMMAHRLPGICPDGVLYIHAAKAVEAGNARLAFNDLDFNIYPIVIAGMHRLGFDWELGAMVWGVAISSLVVLPLWGWLRRQFDDRVALMACMLYAVHPKFIEWSPEIMRDPTFWMLFMLSIYWLWRGATEVRLRYYLAALAAIILATLTRIEGVFLLIPLVLWTFWRWRALEPNTAGSLSRLSPRRKLLFGLALCAIVPPGLAAIVHFGWLQENAGWSLFRLDPLERVQSWLAHLYSGSPGNDPAASTMTVFDMAWIYFPTLTRGLSPIYALAMLGGLWGWRRLWARRDNQPLFYVAASILCAIWIHLWYGRNICPRYVLPIVLMASPFAALGLLGFVERLARLAGRFRL
ncbi:MAG: glycosyltransferase family 39 protein, partial [Pirellulaceae bacterium]|nr:glycosyltransferase family 39 protein [Pirellulaceae bacterium]